MASSSYARHAAPLFVVALAMGLGVHRASAQSSEEAPTGQKDACKGAFERGQILRRDGRLHAALAHLTVCRESCPDDVAAKCDEWTTEVQTAMPSLLPTARDRVGRPLTAVSLSVDGKLVATRLDGDPVEVDPGEHRLAFVLPSGDREEAVVTVQEGDKMHKVAVTFARAEAPAPPAPPARPPPTPQTPASVYIFGGVGLVALAAAGVLATVGHVQRIGLEQCRPSCDPSKREPIVLEWDIAGGAAAVGAVSLGVATALWLSTRHRAAPGSRRRSGLVLP